MKIIALMPCRNEDWVLGLSIRAALTWCDGVLVLLHACSDASAAIVEQCAAEYPGRVFHMVEKSPEWREMEQRQAMLECARALDPTHIAIVDADEVICGDSIEHVRAWAERLMPGECLNARMHCMWRSVDHYRTDPESIWSNRRDLALVFRDSPILRWNAAPDGYQHHSREPKGSSRVFSAAGPFVPGKGPHLGVMHLQFADWRRLQAKHALYKVHERITYPNRSVDSIERMYNLALDERGLKTAEAPAEWWDRHLPLVLRYLTTRVDPWQEAQVRAMVAQHGADMFAGLDLFGLVPRETGRTA